jgi:exopolyphosphatase/guanosine-5'-triphosphate,3'-diphosphate pyrophosphatase
MKNLASIDIGSHTARLLVAQKVGYSRPFRPLFRERAYIRLAEGFDDQGEKMIKPEAIDRALNALEDFAAIVRKFNVENTYAVSTGVVREAANRDYFLNLIYDQTGIEVKAISGEEEARLTGKGVLHSLEIQGRPYMIFDLGGGSTEFFIGEKEERIVKSIPLGAMILTQKFLNSDPPGEEAIESLVKHVDKVLQKTFSWNNHSASDFLPVGTGGTVTTLAAMIYGIHTRDINPERMNGLILERERLEDLFSRIKTMTIKERLKRPGLDQGRADVILAGSLVVIRVLHFFNAFQMMVSLSDLLEGILIAYLQGEEDE